MAEIHKKAFTLGPLFLLYLYFDFAKLFNHLEQAQGYTSGIAKHYIAGVTFSVPLRRTTQMPLPPDPLIYFVHVGKAGGATIYRELNMAENFKGLKRNLKRKKKALKCRIQKKQAKERRQRMISASAWGNQTWGPLNRTSSCNR
jgi:hypothetical protein